MAITGQKTEDDSAPEITLDCGEKLIPRALVFSIKFILKKII